LFWDLIVKKGSKPEKNAQGKMQFIGPKELDTFKSRLAQKFNIDKNSILTYDEMMAKPKGTEPKWNVIVVPGDGDDSANRADVNGSYLLFH
jgi:hypothetical protein